MQPPSHNLYLQQGAPRAELARLCRQICLARELGRMSPVTAEDEFGLALTTVRATYGPASINEEDLKDIVATEESRVADAAVLADLISSRLGTKHPASQPAFPSAPEDQASPSLTTPIPFPTGGSSSPLNIADLLGGMLNQEKRDVRSVSASSSPQANTSRRKPT